MELPPIKSETPWAYNLQVLEPTRFARYNLEGCVMYTTAHPDLMSLGVSPQLRVHFFLQHALAKMASLNYQSGRVVGSP